MATLILVEGVPGSGKSTSMRTLDPKSTYIILPNAKSLPFKGAKAKYKETQGQVPGNLKRTDNINHIPLILQTISEKTDNIKTVVIDDFSHFLNSKVYSKGFTKQTGFSKWSELAQEVFENIIKTAETLREDLTIVLMAHTKESADSDGNKKVTMRTCGETLPISA